VDVRSWLGLEPTHNPMRWYLPITPGISTGHSFLFGGCGLGAAIAAMEDSTGRPVVWATAQYLSFARPPALLELDVTEVVRGHQISQARVIARVGDTEILTVLGALGRRPLALEGQWAVRPHVPPPLECPPRPLMDRHAGTISSRLDAKLASGRAPWEFPGPPGSGNAALWIRLPELLDMSAAALAIIGDFVPFGIGQALGKRAGGNSLDNTLRVAHRVPTEWVLADVRIHAVADGFGHGLVHLWAEDGTLLGTASQSAIVRAWRDDQHEPLTELEGEVRPR
jgi:acyl-CoA thioesterase